MPPRLSEGSDPCGVLSPRHCLGAARCRGARAERRDEARRALNAMAAGAAAGCAACLAEGLLMFDGAREGPAALLGRWHGGWYQMSSGCSSPLRRWLQGAQHPSR